MAMEWMNEWMNGDYHDNKVDRDNTVGIVTRYGLHDPRIEFRWGRDFPHSSKMPWGQLSVLWNGYWVSLPGVKRPRRGVDHPPHLASRVKKE
jgi:hypothetical protein